MPCFPVRFLTQQQPVLSPASSTPGIYRPLVPTSSYSSYPLSNVRSNKLWSDAAKSDVGVSTGQAASKSVGWLDGGAGQLAMMGTVVVLQRKNKTHNHSPSDNYIRNQRTGQNRTGQADRSGARRTQDQPSTRQIRGRGPQVSRRRARRNRKTRQRQTGRASHVLHRPLAAHLAAGVDPSASKDGWIGGCVGFGPKAEMRRCGGVRVLVWVVL